MSLLSLSSKSLILICINYKCIRKGGSTNQIMFLDGQIYVGNVYFMFFPLEVSYTGWWNFNLFNK